MTEMPTSKQVPNIFQTELTFVILPPEIIDQKLLENNTLGDLGGARDALPFPDKNFFIFRQFGGKIGQIIGRSPLRVGAPLWKSWIHQYIILILTIFHLKNIRFNTKTFSKC